MYKPFLLSLFALTGILLSLAPVRVAQGNSSLTPIVLTIEHHDTSAPLTTLQAKPVPPKPNGLIPLRTLAIGRRVVNDLPAEPDEAPMARMPRARGAMPAPLGGWRGISASDSSCDCLPPDPNGDVGPNHYVQTVNTAFQIWDKNGTSLFGPVPNNLLFDGFGGACEDTNDGDPIVLYDHLADRWFFSQFANVFSTGPYYQCLAVSATGDPLGAWHRYSVVFPDNLLNDYSKFGVWPDAYYMTTNLFQGSSWGGTGVLAFERAKMLNGEEPTVLYLNLGPTDWGGMLPSDLDGLPPPDGTPTYFVEIQDRKWDPINIPNDRIQVWAFHVDWNTPSNSTFTNIANLAVNKFNGILCGFNRNCIPQKGTSRKLDAISDRGMYRAQYRHMGSYGTIVFNHTVNVGNNRAGIRWYELHVSGGVPTIYQQGTYAPDDNSSRWMGSAAMDKQGNLAIGFSRSSTRRYPSIFYAGRLAGDPLGELAQGERRMKRGKGAQTSIFSRWGDYSMLAVDPSDDCTFWYTQEYYQTTGDRNWKTWIGRFKFDDCN